MRTTDRRFIKTEKSIHGAMVSLLQKNNYQSLSIEDITYEADINKSTFYLHYQSLEQLRLALEDSFISGLTAMLYQREDTSDTESFMTDILDHLSKNKLLGIAVFKSSSLSLCEKLETLFRRYLKPLKVSKTKKISDPNIFIEAALINTIVSILRTWVLDSCKYDKQFILEKCIEVVESPVFEEIVGNK